MRTCINAYNIDAAKFGSAYLTKMGWNPSQGLGIEGEGRTSHIKVAQKLNLLGIGAGAQQGDKEGIAWRQNRDFEVLLKRLNESQGEDDAERGLKEQEQDEAIEVQKQVQEDLSEEVEGKKRKRAKDKDGDEKGEKKKRKKDKLSKELDGADDEKKTKKKKKKEKRKEGEDDKDSNDEPKPIDQPAPVESPESSQNINESAPSSGSQTPIPRPKA